MSGLIDVKRHLEFLKQMLLKEPILKYPDPSKPIHCLLMLVNLHGLVS